ncbi:MCE family protein [Nocardia higoensis]|uniref:MCE family protein n=1 Tax=Nocardia higoensis TaxID=228599 RepID=A0ABS0D7S6_9NOCA|nr:MCE family protein [Nocardia higoensis]MBF6354155.1 MCE family protein [Nocardia higoensis]
MKHFPPSRVAVAACLLLTVTGCGTHGVNSVPLPGAEANSSQATIISVEIANVGTLTPNSPVMVDDVVVGSVRTISLDGWHAVVEAAVRPETVIPADAVATVGQTSLLGSTHLALNTPDGEQPTGRLESGARLPLNRASTYPSTEQTLASLSVVVNGGGLGQLGDIVAELNNALDGRGDQVVDLLARLDGFMAVLADQRAEIVASIEALTRLGETFAGQTDTLTRALDILPPTLDLLLAERPALTDALERLRVFSDTATGVVTEVSADLIADLRNLEPTLKAVADVGPLLDAGLAYATVYPYGQQVIDRAVRGDYINLHATVDLTIPRLQRELLQGTPWADPHAVIQAAIGDPGYAQQTSNPLGVGLTPPGTGGR